MKMKQPKIWVISDTHFFHKGIVRRGVRPPDHNERTAEALSKLGPDDTLIHLGDFAFAKYSEAAEIMNRCPARSKILLLGNHDNQSYSYYTRHGFTAAMETMTLQHGGKNILFSHRPVSEETFGWQARFEEGELHLPQGADLNIHGHLHLRNHRDEESAWQDEKDERWFLLSHEAVGYRPVLLDDILEGKIPRVLKEDAMKYVHDPEKVFFDPIPKN
jgi:calcineurin-like phosphoesterase family protein|tara:strand:+ start:1260 stop:1910 length:651 start_codon:yes stop_codon:yes gene_type:complete